MGTPICESWNEKKMVVEGSTSLKNVGFVKVEKRGWLLLETDHLWGLHVNSCVLTLSELLSGFSAYLDDGFEYCPPTGPLPTTKIIWINRCLDKETRLDEDRFSICMTQKLASKEKKENLFMKKKAFLKPILLNPTQSIMSHYFFFDSCMMRKALN